ncbi:RusA family crossover junction endodeoxyribonuclease [Gilvimarinus sp. 1_MG-2023]|uniref:RusA family crossover junction endodeoxyribonuclease n=1 Tax=Gilvimarinus sp. 1_MG-2023 TaxID=3062638 RepID=UPI0026E29787|nr:RusA family crossover junction endodeoxyribonuclease [Gilvimarinus sp. 1_MG-2023]MDO6747182.1 RusA family crossover junction endodeoxyribonuclease [Gilvimarinus sp. 1_MG-2023]
MIEFHIPGKPQGKGRARSFLMRNGKIGHHTPEKTRSYEGMIRTLGMQAVGDTQPTEQPIALTLTIVMPIPASWPAWKRELAESGRLLPTTKPDSDNVEKAVKDALNGVCWRDDAQVVSADKNKFFESPDLPVGVHVEVRTLGEYPAQLKRKPEAPHWPASTKLLI